MDYIKSARELLGGSTSSTCCAFSSIVFICFSDGFSGQDSYCKQH
jgi:hypothetical protein